MTKHFYKLTLVAFLVIFALPGSVFAGRGDKTKSIHTPQGGSAVRPGEATARDTVSLDPLMSNQRDYSVTNRISFGVDMHYPEFVAGPQIVEVSLHIKRWDVNNNPMSSVDLKLNIAYRHTDTLNSKILDKYEFSGAYKVMFRIDTIRISGVIRDTLPKNLFVQGDIFVERYTELSTSPVINNAIQFLDLDCNDIKDGLRFSWKPLTGAEEYQLEFLHISNFGSMSSSTDPNYLDYDYKHNSTRITTAKTYYDIPLIFDQGWVACRVRGVGVDIDDPEHLIYGEWSTMANTGTIASIDNDSKIEITSAESHQNQLNWQYSAIYAEQGKRKENINYFDGTLRSRQSVSKANSDKQVLVGETIYDHQGRPVINVLPTPVEFPNCDDKGEPVITYYPRFNVNADGKSYSKQDFDITPSGEGQECAVHAAPMSTASGASRYYSADNPNKELQQAFLPDAEGYPFQQIVYTPDNTNRIAAEGGLGPDLQIGSGKEVRYIYSNPNQLELNRMFGSEAGYAEHYQKNMQIDANGVVTVSYIDMHNRVVATALAGSSPENLKEIKGGQEQNLKVDYILPDGSNQTVDQIANTITISTSFSVSSPTNATIGYELVTVPMLDSCLPGICVDCIYQMDLVLRDECGQDLISDTLKNKIIGNFARNSNGDYVFHNHCQDSTMFAVGTTIDLPIGKYSLSKKLTISEDALNAYLALIDSSDCAKTYQDFLDGEMQNVDSSVCMVDCSNCLEQLGSMQDFISNGLGTANEYYSRVQECQELCEDRVSDCKMYLTLMQIDMSPGGQYAQYLNPSSGATDLNMPLSVMNANNLLPNANASWRNPVLIGPNGNQPIYVDEYGDRAKVFLSEDAANPGNYLPQPLNNGLVQYDSTVDKYFVYPEQLADVLDFIDAFETSWAISLVKYHPEYCYYESCIQYEDKHAQADAFSSESFDNLLLSTNTFAQAQAAGFISAGGTPTDWFAPNGFDPTDSLKPWDPFVFYSADFDEPLCSGYGQKLWNKYFNYKYEFGQWFSMPEIAAYTIRCGSALPNVPAVDCYNFGQTYNGALDTSILNNEWMTLRALYLSAKQELQQELANCKAVAYCDAFNKCVGNSNYSPFPLFGFIQLSPSTQYYPFWDHGQPCSVFTASLYRYKTKRFSNHEDAMAEDANSTSYQVYLQTGQCPTAFSLQHLLDEIVHSNALTSTSFNLNSTSYLTALLQASNAYYNPGSTPPLNYSATATSSNITADWNDGSSTLATLTLDKTAPQTWSQVTGIINLFATGPHTFTAEATYVDIATSTMHVFPITGSLSYFELDGCTFEQECESNQLALDLTTMLNVLLMDGNLGSTTPINLTSYYSSSMASTVNLTSLYIQNAADAGPNLSFVTVGTNTMKIYNASSPGTDGLYVQFTGLTGSLTSATTTYLPMTSTGTYSFEMGANQAVGYPVTFSGVLYQIHGGDTTGLSAGDCALPTPSQCEGLAFEVFEDLQPLITDMLTSYDGTSNIDLYSSIYTTPAIVTALPFGVEHTISNDYGDTLVISAGGCDLVLSMDTSTYVQFDNIVALSNFALTGDLDNQSAYTNFTCLATFQTPSGTIQDSIWGNTCFSMKDCSPCGEVPSLGVSALRQLAIPINSESELENVMASLDDGLFTQQVSTSYDTTGCYQAYTNYLWCVNNFNQNYSYYQLSPVTQSDFIDRQYCHCVESYCAILEELLANNLQFPNLDAFKQFTGFQNACTECTEYATYVAAIDYYNTHTNTYHVLDVIPAELFNAYGYCNCVKPFGQVLSGILLDNMTFENQQHFDNYASMARICSDDIINVKETPCKYAYGEYLNCTFNFVANNPTPFTLSYFSVSDFDSLSLCNCVDEYCSALDAVLTGIVNFSDQAGFEDYVFGKLDCNPQPPCTPAPTSGIPPEMPTVELQNDCIASQINLAIVNAQNAYEQYLDSINTVKRQKYLDHCLITRENLTNNYTDKQYHYMLYYYDQAGNMIKTVPSEGVQLLPFTSTNDALNLQIDNDRATGNRTVFTSHRLQTRFEYNSLNQLIGKSTPDTDPMLAFEQTLPNGLNSKLVTLKIQMLNEATGYLAGYVGTRGHLYKTQDGGLTWKRVNNLLSADLKKITMLDANLGIAVGEAGTVLKTTDGGLNWEMVDTWTTSGMIKSINDLAVISPTSSPTVMLVGDDQLAAICNNFGSGSPTFTISNSGLSGNVLSIEVLSGAFYCTAHDPISGISRFYRYSSSTWSEVSNVGTNNFSDVHLYEADRAFACDLDGRIFENKMLSSTPSVWIHRSSDLKDSIVKARFFDPQQGISLVKKNGYSKLYRTTDSAKSWNPISDSTYSALAIAKDNTVAAASGPGKRIALIFPYSSGTDQLVEVSPPTNAGSLATVWVEKTSSGGVLLMVSDDQRIFFTVNALIPNPVWYETNYASIGTSLTQVDAELMPTGNVYGVAITASGQAWRLKRESTPEVQLSAIPFSGTSYAAVTKADNFFYLTRTTSSAIVRVNKDGSTSTSTVAGGTLPFTGNHISGHGQKILTASSAGNIAVVNLNPAGTNITTIDDQSLKVYPDRINRLRKDVTLNKLLAFGDDGLVYHFSPTAFTRVTNQVNENIYDAYIDNSLVYIVGQAGLAKQGTLTGYLSLTTQDLMVNSGQTVAGSIANKDLYTIQLTPLKRLYAAGQAGALIYSPLAYGPGAVNANVLPPGIKDLHSITLKAGSENVIISGSEGTIQEEFGAMSVVNMNIFIPPITDVNFRDASSATLIAKNFVARTTSNGGGNWKIVLPQGTTSPSATYNKVWTLPAGRSLLFGNGNALLNNSISGTTSTAFAATDVKAVSRGTTDQNIFIVDGNQVRKVDLTSSSATLVHTISGSTAVNAIKVFDNGDHILVGNLGLYRHYTATGSLLTYPTGLPSTDFTAVDFFDHVNGIIVGANGTYYRTSDQTVSVTGYLDATQWSVRNLAATDPLGIGTANIYTLALAASTNILVGGENPVAFSTAQTPYVRPIYDAGGRYSSRYWYDRLGRLILSRNSQQEPYDRYTYMLYDDLGRVIQSGEKKENASNEMHFREIFGDMVNGHFSPQTINDQNFLVWINGSGPRTEVTHTYFDSITISGLPSYMIPEAGTQMFRTSHVTYEEVYDGDHQTYDHGTHYLYDIHGNVSTLLQDNKKMSSTFGSLASQRFKRIEYSYDQVSANVHRVSVQDGEPDQLHLAYIHDADNRLRRVYSNTHSPLTPLGRLTQDKENELLVNSDWQNDAQYYYYDHGPLARTELGQNNLQGGDCFYTIHGWLKGLNSSLLEGKHDPGKDGQSGSPNSLFARDVTSFGLYYFEGDYQPIQSNGTLATVNPSSTAALNSYDLYNGNIRYVQNSIKNPQTNEIMPMLNAYKYDQLDRLVESRSFEHELYSNEWNPSSYANEYYNEFSYDGMGNILEQKRHKRNGDQIEDLKYMYQRDGSGNLVRNRLYHVNDNISAGLDSTDIDDMGAFNSAIQDINSNNNYVYDVLGRLVKDRQEEIDSIIWRTDGKIREIWRDPASNKNNLAFEYDANGNRIAKHVFDNQTLVLIKSTYYLLDGEGSPMNIYEHSLNGAGTDFYLTERFVYGPSRLATIYDTVAMLNPVVLPSYGFIGNRQYELGNHLGNVLATISDIIIPISYNNITVAYYDVGIRQVSDYSPFGVQLDGKNIVAGISGDFYRYGFQGQELDNEIKGTGNSYNYEYRMHDPRLGRFFTVDPLTGKYPWYTPYQFSGNKLISHVELEGLEESPSGSGSSTTTVQEIDDYEKFGFIGKIVTNAPKMSALGADGLSTISIAKGSNVLFTTVQRESSFLTPGGYESIIFAIDYNGSTYTWNPKKKWYANDKGKEYPDPNWLMNAGMGLTAGGLNMTLGDGWQQMKQNAAKANMSVGDYMVSQMASGIAETASDIWAGGHRGDMAWAQLWMTTGSGGGELVGAGYAGLKFGLKTSVTLTGKYVLWRSTKNALEHMTVREFNLFSTTTSPGLRSLMYGKGVDAAFRFYGSRNIYFKGLSYFNMLELGSRTRGADMFGKGMLKGYWWDVTTPGSWQKHVTKYGKGGTGLLYKKPN